MAFVVASTNWASFAIAIGGPAVGIAGVAFGWLNSRGERQTSVDLAAAQREHDRDLARDARLFEDLRSAYVRLSTFLLVMSAVVERTHPSWARCLTRPNDPATPKFGRSWLLSSSPRKR